MASKAALCSWGGKCDVNVMGVRGGDGVDRRAKLVRAAIEELEEIVDNVRCRSWLDRLESFSLADGWTGMVALEATEEVEVRRSCLCAGEDDEGEDRLGDADMVRMLVGEPALWLVGEEEAVDICPEAASGNTVARGARGAGIAANPWPYEWPRISGWGLSVGDVTECVDGGRVMDCRL